MSKVGVMTAERIKAETGIYRLNELRRLYETSLSLVSRNMAGGRLNTMPNQNINAISRDSYSVMVIRGTATPSPKWSRNLRPVGSIT